MPSPSELLSCKGKAATADAKYRLKARKLKSFLEAFHNSHGIGYSQKISTILLGVLLKSILERRHEKGYGVKGMPECHKKISVSCGKQVFKKAGAQEIQNFPRGGRAEAGHDYTCHVV